MHYTAQEKTQIINFRPGQLVRNKVCGKTYLISNPKWTGAPTDTYVLTQIECEESFLWPISKTTSLTHDLIPRNSLG